MKINSSKAIEYIGIAGTVLGIGATLLSKYSEGKKLDSMLDEKVNEAVIKKLAELGNNQEG